MPGRLRNPRSGLQTPGTSNKAHHNHLCLPFPLVFLFLSHFCFKLSPFLLKARQETVTQCSDLHTCVLGNGKILALSSGLKSNNCMKGLWLAYLRSGFVHGPISLGLESHSVKWLLPRELHEWWLLEWKWGTVGAGCRASTKTKQLGRQTM